MCQKHYTIPVFIPQLACPFQCVYCNQRNSSGQNKIPTVKEIVDTIEQHLKTIPSSNTHREIGFFGGSFTGLPLAEQELFLKSVQPYFKSGAVQGIRLSTRPDYIRKDILDLLQQYHVTTIELGVQSMDAEVLQLSGRGHTSEDVISASKLIKEYGFLLGLQMMLGLPSDTPEKSLYTAESIVAFGADNTRIYPALVIKDTELEKLFREEKYVPLTIEEAVIQTKEVYKIFEKANVKVLRMGLHPSEGLISGESLVAGPFHVSFGELVMTALWEEALMLLLQKKEKNSITVSVPCGQLNNAVGYGASNKKMLQHHFGKVKFIEDSLLTGRNYHAE